MTIIRPPRVDSRPETHTIGIRTRTPMKGMSKQISALFKELDAWIKQHPITPSGLPFLRFHVIDMAGEMDIEVGYPVTAGYSVAAPAPALDGSRVVPGLLPAGRYASLVYTGSGIAGNKALIEWAKANGHAWDRWQDPHGDAFRARYETYLTDPKTEPRKTRWEIEVAIKLKD